MASIVIVCPSQPSRTPRLVRNAGALSAAGHKVTVVTPVFEAGHVKEDHRITTGALWEYIGVPLLHPSGKSIPVMPRLIRRSVFEVASRLGVASLGSTALIYGSERVMRAANIKADFYLGQQQSSLPIVASLARRYGKPYGCDIEDILTESSSEPRRLLQAIELRYLGGAGGIFTMSRAAAEHLNREYQLKAEITVAHNCPALAERGQLTIPIRSTSSRPSIYWFGQSLGPHSCALELLKANVAAGSPCKIYLRGRPVPSYVEELWNFARASAVPDILEILPVTPPDTMVAECAKFDVLFGSQPSDELFHQLAIGNKVFAGLAAGCALLLEDTIAHRSFYQEMSSCSTLVAYRDPAALAGALSGFLDSDRLIRQRRAAWEMGSSTYNWEYESQKVVQSISSALYSSMSFS
ncbi:MAG: glycosyltransferase [Verrucomicrobiota bacterium]